jgi:hypothetical protein
VIEIEGADAVAAHGRRSGRRRAGARLGVVLAAVLAAVALVVGVGSAAPGLLDGTPAGPTTGSLLGGSAPAAPPAATDAAGGLVNAVSAVPGCLITVRACVNLDEDTAWLLDGGRIVRGPVPIRPGDDERPTPRGLFSVQWKANPYTSREFLVQMPYAVFFAAGGIAFHEGSPDTYSAGCVKLDEEDAKAFFDFLQVGDGVQVL